MNRTEKLICLLLGAILVWHLFLNKPDKPATPAQPAVATATVAATNAAAVASEPAKVVCEGGTCKLTTVDDKPANPTVPEKRLTLENELVKVELSSWGAVVKRVTLKRFAREVGEVGEGNPPVELDYSASELGKLQHVPGLAENAAYEVRSVTSNSAVFVNAKVTRKVTLEDDYRIRYEETFAEPAAAANTLALGAMRMGNSKSDLLSIDSWQLAGEGKVVHHDEDDNLKTLLVGGLTGGCSGCGGAQSAANFPAVSACTVPGARKWVAVKNRFFVTALCSSSQTNVGFDAAVARDLKVPTYRPEYVASSAKFEAVPATRNTVFYAGPKQQSLLFDNEMRDVMEFGMWRWLCYPLVWVLNFFYALIPNYGVAIILLTILVRLLFWPLTHKSTVGMRKMQELQPKMKAIQAQFKDNPQRMQQEIWGLYRAEKVNPLSSCLPMLIQIPVFIALFNVLRSAVELRYASFLWIADLSEPEGLFAAYLPFGGLNLLPILMAITTGLQSAFTPSTGDNRQKKMMTVFMPLMMLVMFYSFPSALSLYWFLSNVLSIVQMWLIRRQSAKKLEVLTPEVIDPPVTRQMRRHA